MKRFVIKLLLYLSPLLLILFVYFYTDPFKVVHHYTSAFKPVDSFYFDVAGDHISTQTLIQNYPQYQYDSYIFGSSRSGNYPVAEWAKHIRSKNCYHFGANYESLYGVEKKFQLIKKNGYALKNALIIIDNDLLSAVTDGKGHLRMKHPLLSGQSTLSYHLECLKDYFDKDFLPGYLKLFFTGKPLLNSAAFSPLQFYYDVAHNEFLRAQLDSEIVHDPAKYYATHGKIFYDRPVALHYAKPVIGVKQKELLNSIKGILNSYHTEYRIVISPLYDQLKEDTTDLRTLQNIFGSQYVFDLSGINDITNDKHNYYETSHYRPNVCVQIMDSVYRAAPVR